MFKGLHSLRSKAVQSRKMVANQVRSFSERQIRPPNFGGGGLASYALIGAGTAGIAYLMLRGKVL